MDFNNFVKELKRRNVIKAALAYIVFSWVFIQVFSILLPTFEAPVYVMKLIVAGLMICFPIWLIFSWVYEITPDGIKKTINVTPETSIAPETSNRLNKIIIGALGIAIILLAINLFNDKNATTVTESGTNAKVDKSIAVLAFADMSQEKDQEYFSDGISEEILNLLAKIPDLKVISRTSSFSYKGKEQNIQKIGQELHVAHVLEGSIRKSGNTFRITVQLINVADGAHIWSETYDREMSDIFKVQDEIAGKVTQQLKATLLGVIASTPVNPEAYNLYLQAKQVRRQQSEESEKSAEILIRKSIAIDSSYAPAWGLLSRIIYNQIYRFTILPMSQENIATGMYAAKKTLLLDSKYAEGYAYLARFERTNWDFKASAANMTNALSLAPENPEVINEAAANAADLGKLKEALRLQLKMLELDPLNYFNYFNLGLHYYLLNDYKNAEKSIQSFLLYYPSTSTAYSQLSLVFLGQGENAKALEALEKEPDMFFKLYSKCKVMYAIGDQNEADAQLKKLIADWGDVAWPNIASVFAFRGERDNAFKWLDLAYENRDGSTLEILNYPEMVNLWGDPRWNKFINKLGLPKDHGFHMD
ncbi:hypothetical protein ACFO5O_08635 [Geojedonia litorea]|uniref:TolB amino-terminal domain-containing protein n=1 Tax=Geojedonia litorea TaxID=1268269 RepID=A0ABV9N281_9FLAO